MKKGDVVFYYTDDDTRIGMIVSIDRLSEIGTYPDKYTIAFSDDPDDTIDCTSEVLALVISTPLGDVIAKG